MRAIQKLVRNGNSTQITIPRTVLIHLGWIPGQPVILEILEDRSIVIRTLREADLAPARMLPTVFAGPAPVKP